MSSITNNIIQFKPTSRNIECDPESILKMIETAFLEKNPDIQRRKFQCAYENFCYSPRENDEMEIAFIKLMMYHALCQEEPKQTHQLEYVLIRLLFLMDSYPHSYEWPKVSSLETFSDNLDVFRVRWFQWCHTPFDMNDFLIKADGNHPLTSMMRTILQLLIETYCGSSSLDWVPASDQARIYIRLHELCMACADVVTISPNNNRFLEIFTSMHRSLLHDQESANLLAKTIHTCYRKIPNQMRSNSSRQLYIQMLILYGLSLEPLAKTHTLQFALLNLAKLIKNPENPIFLPAESIDECINSLMQSPLTNVWHEYLSQLDRKVFFAALSEESIRNAAKLAFDYLDDFYML